VLDRELLQLPSDQGSDWTGFGAALPCMHIGNDSTWHASRGNKSQVRDG